MKSMGNTPICNCQTHPVQDIDYDSTNQDLVALVREFRQRYHGGHSFDNDLMVSDGKIKLLIRGCNNTQIKNQIRCWRQAADSLLKDIHISYTTIELTRSFVRSLVRRIDRSILDNDLGVDMDLRN